MAYRHQSSLLGQLKVNDPKDIQKDMCLYTYVIELPGVKAEDVKIRVSEGRFLTIEAHGRKETVSPLEAELERIIKRCQQENEENDRKRQEETQKKVEEIERKGQEEREEFQRQQRERMEESARVTEELLEKFRSLQRAGKGTRESKQREKDDEAPRVD